MLVADMGGGVRVYTLPFHGQIVMDLKQKINDQTHELWLNNLK